MFDSEYILYYSIHTNMCMSCEALIVKTLKTWICKTVILLPDLLIWTKCELQVGDLRHSWLFGDSVDPAAGWWWHVDVVCVASAGNTDDIYTVTSLTGEVNIVVYFTLENKVLLKY